MHDNTGDKLNKRPISHAERGRMARGKPKNYSDLEILRRVERIQKINQRYGRVGSEARKRAKIEEDRLVKSRAEQGLFTPIGAKES